jgi:hypothetical protein
LKFEYDVVIRKTLLPFRPADLNNRDTSSRPSLYQTNAVTEQSTGTNYKKDESIVQPGLQSENFAMLRKTLQKQLVSLFLFQDGLESQTESFA